jgi:tetratricopeptide (TPR) repeat protein
MLGNLGYVELSIGDIDTARGHLLESLDMARELNDHYGVVYETFNLGLASYLSGSPDAAADLFVESLHLAKRMQMKQSIAYALIGVAMAGSGADGMSRSARLHGAAEQALTALGETIEPLEGGLRDRDCGRLRSAMGAEAFGAEYAAGRALTFEQVLALALGNQTLCPCSCGLPGPAGGQTRGNHQGSPWGDAAVELLSVIPDTTSRRGK